MSQIFDVLADSSRRYTLSYLQKRSRPVAIADLAAAIVEHQQNTSETVTDEALHQEYTALHHQHLPKLEDANLIQRNCDQNTVEAADVPQKVTSFLALAATRDQ